MEIRKTTAEEIDSIVALQRAAFGSDDEAELTRILLDDPATNPKLSMVAVDKGALVGHVLLTRASVEGHDQTAALMLAPLGVVPEHQNQGIGSTLTEGALRAAGDLGTALVFLAGHPGFYPRFGFHTGAADLGFLPPVPIPPAHADAWMVAELVPGTIGGVTGRIIAADELMDPKYWTE